MDTPRTEAEDELTFAQRMARLWNSHQFRKLIRYSAVSVVFVPIGQAIVQILHLVFDVNESLSVLIAAMVLTPPNYFANKNYVWRHKRIDNMKTEITVFWVAAILGTAFSMGAVALAGTWFPEEKALDISHAIAARNDLWHGVAIFIAQLVGYGVVWVARFLFLDKLVFTMTHHGEDQLEVPATSELDERPEEAQATPADGSAS